jgi:tripartite-type tricarboxylate transporter receptor subunit TctC
MKNWRLGGMKNTLSRRRALSLAGGALAAPMLASGIARAATDWPNKPVRYINSFPAGGPTDVLSRVACQKLSELTGQQFIVENKGGSGGNVGADAIAHAAPDGYTIGLYSVASHAIGPTLYAKLPFDADKDFTAVTMLWSLPNLLIVRPGVPAKTVSELIGLARDNPGKYSFASSGSGTTVHLSGELFKSMAKIDLLHVPYRGSAPAIQDLLAGQVDMIFDNIPGSLAQVRNGRAVGLAVTSRQRSRSFRRWPSSCPTSTSLRGAASADPPACRRRWSRSCRRFPSWRWRARTSRRPTSIRGRRRSG